MSSIADSQAATLSPEDLRTQVAGTWKLMTAEDQQPDGSWKPGTFGTPPSGYFIYNPNGYASVQIMTVPPVVISAPDSPTPAEALEIFNNYIAYYGTWTVDADTLTVQVEGAWDPSQVGTAQARPYSVDGDTLTIGSVAAGYIRTLKRMV
ncbi:MAG TPA: lipocalin-like domain-containing protein [Longimicrobium sp.]|nr:lipocalin-like domain-containing protein [Longimicrobium sp.]